mmetsp:Transcript_124829/g.296209  ORF Transcript_124829/g.296209 Transcript_124829/m.296209 type:complete len:236 (+) Transcript_124829:1039-1746(+)
MLLISNSSFTASSALAAIWGSQPLLRSCRCTFCAGLLISWPRTSLLALGHPSSVRFFRPFGGSNSQDDTRKCLAPPFALRSIGTGNSCVTCSCNRWSLLFLAPPKSKVCSWRELLVFRKAASGFRALPCGPKISTRSSWNRSSVLSRSSLVRFSIDFRASKSTGMPLSCMSTRHSENFPDMCSSKKSHMFFPVCSCTDPGVPATGPERCCRFLPREKSCCGLRFSSCTTAVSSSS